MGLKYSIKQAIIKSVMAKRKKNLDIDEVQTELHVMPDDADYDINHSYYFGSHDLQGNTFFLRLGLRGGEDRKAEIWFVYKTACGKAFVNEIEHLDAKDSTLKIECIEPLKKWKLVFNGKVIPVAPDSNTKLATPIGKSVNASFEAIFESNTGLYHFSRDVDNRAFAKAMAAEVWVKGFADELKNNNQVHIEQDGKAAASIKVDGESFSFCGLAVRDHSYGRRVWSYMNTYHWLPAIFENGYIYNPNLVRYPAINKRGLITGYKMKDGNWTNIIDVDFPSHAISGLAPIGGEYTITFDNLQRETVSFTPEIIFNFNFKDKGGTFHVFAAVSKFAIGELKGRGSAEFGYHGDKTRYEIL